MVISEVYMCAIISSRKKATESADHIYNTGTVYKKWNFMKYHRDY